MGIKHWFTLTALAAVACGNALAQEQARVLSAIPVMQQVDVPQQFCENEQVYAGNRTNGTGAILGAVIGGVAGNAMGRGGHYGPRGRYYGSNRGPSTVVGAIAGGLIGHAIESSHGQPSYETVRRCTTETIYEDRAVGYDVTYEYAGRRYTTRLDHDPGSWIPVNVQPQGRYSSSSAQSGTRFVGPSGVYQSAPAGTMVTQGITYSPPDPLIVVDVEAGGYPPPPPRWHRAPPPPTPYYWR